MIGTQERKAGQAESAAPSAENEAPNAAPSHQRFTNEGPIPPVAQSSNAVAPGASDLAFGAHDEHYATADNSLDDANHLRVKATGLNVRSSPNARGHANIVGLLHHGDQIERVGKAGHWVQISYQGQQAFVHGAYVEAAHHAEAKPAKAPSEPQPESVANAVEKATQHAPEIKQHLPEKKVTENAPHASATHAPSETKAPESKPAAENPAPTAPVINHAPVSNAPVAKAADHAPAAEHAPPVEEKHDKPKAKPHTDKRLLDHELNAVLKQFDHGKLDMQAAVARFVAFDQKHSGGEMSADGQVMLAMLVGMLMAHESEKLRKKYESEHHGPTTAPAEQGKPPVINDHEAPAKGPAPVFNPPANPKLEDQNLDALAAQLHDPKVTKVMADLASAVTVWRTAPRDSFHEIKGEPRENLVHGIAVVREGLKGLGGADEKTAAFKTAVFHKLEQIAPYHHQHNMRTIETGDYTTCNVTSLAMSLEAIGKTAESYKPGKREIIKKVAERCNSSVSKAASTLHGHGASWEAVAGLRFPDFMQLAAISHRLKTPEFSESDFKAAAMFAASNKTHADFLADIASDFSATGKEHYLSFGSEKADKALEKFSDDTQADAQVLIDARNAAEAHPESKVRQDAYAEAQQGRGKKVAGNAKIDRDLPLEHYKATVIGAIKPLMDAGHGVISGCYHHFTRCYEINDKYIMVQDPGQYHRTERKLMWDEARALRYFWNYIVIS